MAEAYIIDNSLLGNMFANGDATGINLLNSVTGAKYD